MGIGFSAIPLQDVKVTSNFWMDRIKATREGALPAIRAEMQRTGRWNCLKLKWKTGDPNKPHQFWDSDVAKWLEGACYALTLEHEPNLARHVEELVDMIRTAQHDDGYINTYYTVVEPDKRFTNIAWSHELYCAGHLLEAGLAHYIYSGSHRLLGPLLKYVGYIGSVFGPEDWKKKGYPGHQELELALIRVYEVTKDKPLLDLATYFIEERGQCREDGHYFDVEAKARGEAARPGPGRGAPYSYHQADKPVREQKSVEGHSVRCMYWLTAVAGLARHSGDMGLRHAAVTLWKSTVHRKMYVTGGVGAMPDWEGFGPDFYLPNESGYLETCASIGLVLFAQQMKLSGVEEAANVLETALYNGVLVGMALDGKTFFYNNPLATIGRYCSRSTWFNVACCPANVARTISSVGQYIYGVNAQDSIAVFLWISSSTTFTLSDGDVVKFKQESHWPWAGNMQITLEGNKPLSNYMLLIYAPTGAKIYSVDSESNSEVTAHFKDGGSQIQVNAKTDALGKSVFRISTELKTRRIHPHILDLDNKGCVAIGRGALIYCAETIDNGHIGDLRGILLPDNAEFDAQTDEELFARFHLGFKPVVLRTHVKVVSVDADLRESTRVETLTLIPYFMWGNRGKSDLRVWLPRDTIQ